MFDRYHTNTRVRTNDNCFRYPQVRGCRSLIHLLSFVEIQFYVSLRSREVVKTCSRTASKRWLQFSVKLR